MKNIVISILLFLLTFSGAIAQRSVREYMVPSQSNNPNPNIPPIVQVVQPLNNAQVVLGNAISVLVNASDPDGSISLVKIILNGNTLKLQRQVPYAASYTPNTLGFDTIYAIAYDNVGDSTISTPVIINIIGTNQNLRPIVQVVQPLNNSKVVIGNAVNVLVNASDPDGSISLVRIVLNGNTLNLQRQVPYAASYTPNTLGFDTIYAIAYDNVGDSTISAPVVINIIGQGPNLPPIVHIAQPLNNDKLVLGNIINVQVNASDPDGAVFSVRMVLNGQTLKWEYLSPFAASYTPTTASTDTIYAVAYDNAGDSTVSTPVIINIIDTSQFKVLHFTKNNGNKPGIADSAQNFLVAQGSTLGFTVDQDSSGSSFDTLANLKQYAVIIFNNTSGNSLLSLNQRANFESYIKGGGNCIGIHASANAYRHSLANGSGTGAWDWYAELYGASVRDTPSFSSPMNNTIRTIGSHITTSHMSDSTVYNGILPYWQGGFFDSTIVPVLSVDPTGNQVYDSSRYVAWYRYLNNGSRVFYTGLGHNASSFSNNNDFRDHLIAAIQWTQKNELPIATITSINDLDTVYKDSVVNITAIANDPDGTVDSVSFKIDNQVLGWDYAAPWSINYTAKLAGLRTITVTAYDNGGSNGTSVPVRIQVVDTSSFVYNGNVLKKLGTFFSHLYSAENVNLKPSGTYEITQFNDIGSVGGWDMPHAGTDPPLTLRYDSIPWLVQDHTGKHMRLNNQVGQVYTRTIPNVNGPYHAFYVVQFYDYVTNYEGYTNAYPGFRDRDAGSYMYMQKGQFSNGSGTMPKNKIIIVEQTAENRGGNIYGKMWVNGKPWDNGREVTFGSADNGGRRDLIDISQYTYGTPSHVGSQSVYAWGLRTGSFFTTAQRDSVYNLLTQYVDTGVQYPIMLNPKTTYSNTNGCDCWYVRSEVERQSYSPYDLSNGSTGNSGSEAEWLTIADTVINLNSGNEQAFQLVNGSPIVTIKYKWTLAANPNDRNTSKGLNNIDHYVFITGANAKNDTLKRSDYTGPDYFGWHDNNYPIGSPSIQNRSQKPLLTHIRVIDAAGHVSPWFEAKPTVDK